MPLVRKLLMTLPGDALEKQVVGHIGRKIDLP